jgi:hypothetical protein
MQTMSRLRSKMMIKTAIEMFQAGLDREYAASELHAMFGSDVLGENFFNSLYDAIAEMENFNNLKEVAAAPNKNE